MNQAIVVALIAGTVTAIGWLVNYVSLKRGDRHKQALAARLAFVDRQLQHLYGPLVFLMHEGTSAFSDLVETLGRSYVFMDDREISEEDLELWLFWVDNDLMPRNAAIQSLLASQSHLIAGSAMPQSYISFIEHYNSWRVSHLRWKEKSIRYSWRSKVNWPDDFEQEIIRTYAKLKHEQQGLLGQVARTTPRASSILRRSAGAPPLPRRSHPMG